MLKETESIAVRAQAVLQAMARRTVTNKIVTALVILLLLVIIALISYFKFIRPRLVPL
jgi:predicted RND superfamily exporter protein